MGSTATSPRAARWYVLLEPTAGEPAAHSELLPAWQVPDDIEICSDGHVVEGGRYRLQVFSEPGMGVVGASMAVDGEEYPLKVVAPEAPCPPGSRHEGMCCRTLALFDPGKSFLDLSYALVRIELSLDLEGGEELALSSLDIPCLTRDPARGRDVDTMLRDLACGTDDSLEWMFSLGSSRGPSWGSFQRGEDSSGPTDRALAAVAGSLDVFESSLPAVREQAASRVTWEERLTPAREVRQCGVYEATWLAHNPSSLQEDCRGAVALPDGRRFSPTRLMVRVPRRSADTYENGVLLGHLSKMSRGLAALVERLSSQLQRACRVIQRLEALGVPGEALPALTAARLGCARLEALSERAEGLLGRSRRLERAYAAAMPDAAAVDLRSTKPRRTRLFCEKAVYARLWGAVSGEAAIVADLDDWGREGLPLQAMRLSTLFELYVLHRLLKWFRDAGFSPADVPDAVAPAVYTHVGRLPGATNLVAGVYRLAREGVRATLWYQPVFHGGPYEEMGVRLHRTTRPLRPDGSFKDPYPYFTPDFLLEVEEDSAVRTVVMDAKFSNSKALLRPTDTDNGRTRMSIFEDVALKYLLATCDARTGRAPDAVWLLACGGQGSFWRYQSSPWACAREGFVYSGIAEVGPGTRSLDGLFAMLGLADPLPDVPAAPAAEAPRESSGPGPAACAGEVLERHGVRAVADFWRKDEPPAGEDGAMGEAPKHSVVKASSPAPAPAKATPAGKDGAPVQAKVPAKVPKKKAAQKPGEKERAGSSASAAACSTVPDAGSPAQKTVGDACPATMSAEELVGLAQALSVRKHLFDQRECRKRYGVDFALLRDKIPAGAQGKAYEEALLDGAVVAARSRFNPVESLKVRKGLLREVGACGVVQKVDAGGGDAAAPASAVFVSAAPAPVALAPSAPAPVVVSGTPDAPEGGFSSGRNDQGRGSHKGHDARRGADVSLEAVGLWRRMAELLPDPEVLYDHRFCQRNLGVNAPVLRKRPVSGGRERYAEETVGAQEAFALQNPNQAQLAKARAFLAQLERKAAAANRSQGS